MSQTVPQETPRADDPPVDVTFSSGVRMQIFHPSESERGSIFFPETPESPGSELTLLLPVDPDAAQQLRNYAFQVGGSGVALGEVKELVVQRCSELSTPPSGEVVDITQRVRGEAEDTLT